ncbi:MAG: aminotransferase class V-fold PLP-dependent enzyme [Anaerolineales bacterium]|nr:aminotransferase class V-fold PLP-dependent enzyme [Anaerolineales bacterium]
MIYFDNAATSWPKPPGVAHAMTEFLEQVGANPGRSGHRLSIDAARIVFNTRTAICRLFNAPDPMRVVFGANITEALNLSLYGLLLPGDHVITTSMEHNAMMRPMRDLARSGVELTILPCAGDGSLDPADIRPAIQPNTVLLALNHGSNVNGTLLPVEEAGKIAREHNLLFLVDTAQTAGALPVDMQQLNIDLLAFTGHKALLGPMGTGGLCIGDRVDVNHLRPLKRGGTGSRSEQEEQPDFLPDKYESGTANTVGLAGLNASLHWLAEKSVETIRSHEISLTQQLIHGLAAIPGVTVYGTQEPEYQTATVSFNIEGLEPSEVGLRLDEEYAILCRVGLHCAPAAHHTLGTFPTGTVRFGMGAFNTINEVNTALQAVSKLAQGAP